MLWIWCTYVQYTSVTSVVSRLPRNVSIIFIKKNGQGQRFYSQLLLACQESHFLWRPYFVLHHIHPLKNQFCIHHQASAVHIALKVFEPSQYTFFDKCVWFRTVWITGQKALKSSGAWGVSTRTIVWKLRNFWRNVMHWFYPQYGVFLLWLVNGNEKSFAERRGYWKTSLLEKKIPWPFASFLVNSERITLVKLISLRCTLVSELRSYFGIRQS